MIVVDEISDSTYKTNDLYKNLFEGGAADSSEDDIRSRIGNDRVLFLAATKRTSNLDQVIHGRSVQMFNYKIDVANIDEFQR